MTVRRRGTLQFGPSGIVAADSVRRVVSRPPRKKDSPANVQHMISVGGKYYPCYLAPADACLPADKSWVRGGTDGPSQRWGAAFGDQLVNV
ncbi:hypothetical protein [Streptosporangium roseum]|uniref:hypothetical protein n=1 Tax=Streptosporangium roseum TaxID=2001 RepID=UPI0004CD2BE0|nr:hypothetical protein [Streptosporangium roseum]